MKKWIANNRALLLASKLGVDLATDRIRVNGHHGRPDLGTGCGSYDSLRLDFTNRAVMCINCDVTGLTHYV